MVDITQALHVTAPWLESGVSLTAVQTMDNVHFAKVLKSDPRIFRLLVGKTRVAESSITISPIIDQLVELRNAKRSKLLGELAVGKALDELDIDDDTSESFAHLLPKIVEITTPAINDTELGLPMKVLCMLPHQPLWVELSHATVGYLHTSLTSQGEPKRRMPSRGPYWDGKRKAYRVRYFENGAGKKFRDFRPSSDSEGDKAAALQLALDFFESHRSL